MKKLKRFINCFLLPLLIILNINSYLFAIQNEQNIQELIDKANSGDTLFLKNGIYEATPKTIIEKICGNCVEPLTDVKATVGFHIKDKAITIYGENSDSTILITNAGYGILFENKDVSLPVDK